MKKLALFIVTAVILSVFVLPASATVADAIKSDTPAMLTPALAIIAENSDMAKAGLVGNGLLFSHDDFCRTLNLSSVGSITVTSLPDPTAGRLLLGTTAVSIGQKISKANLGLLLFSPASDEKCTTAFDFTVEERGYTLTCAVHMLDRINASPVISSTAGVTLDLDTFTDTAGYGRLSGFDPEGDRLTYEIIGYPSHGTVIMTDTANGEYIYFPVNGYSGEDSFRYVVYDKYGNYSAAATVALTVKKPSTNIVYSDMKGNYAANAALILTEKGIMNGSESDGKSVFNPDGPVTRAGFLVMAMKAAGITDLPDVSGAVFADDSAVSSTALPYVAAAKQLGYIEGTELNGKNCFLPDDEITRAEAASIVDRIIGGATLVGNVTVQPTFTDDDEIPVWAESPVANLSLLGMIFDDNGEICATDKLSRADAAVMLAAVVKLKR